MAICRIAVATLYDDIKHSTDRRRPALDTARCQACDNQIDGHEDHRKEEA